MRVLVAPPPQIRLSSLQSPAYCLLVTFKRPCEPTVETLAPLGQQDRQKDDDAGPGGESAQAGGRQVWWARPFLHPVSLSRSRDDRDPGGWASLASRHWAVGQWAEWERFLSSASALDPGLDLGFLFLLACCDPAPACSLPSATRGPELAFLEASSLCSELTRDAGRCQLHN